MDHKTSQIEFTVIVMNHILKRLFTTFLAVFMLGAYPIYAQSETEKLPKEIKRQVKELEKEGWKSAYGARPIAEQLSMVNRIVSVENDEYIVGKGIMDENNASYDYNKSRQRAIDLAKTNLSVMAETHIHGETTSIITNATSTIESTTRAQSAIRMLPEKENIILDLYRQLPDGRYQFRVYMAIRKDIVNEK